MTRFIGKPGSFSLCRVLWKLCDSELYVQMLNWLVFEASTKDAIQLCELLKHIMASQDVLIARRAAGCPPSGPMASQRGDGRRPSIAMRQFEELRIKEREFSEKITRAALRITQALTVRDRGKIHDEIDELKQQTALFQKAVAAAKISQVVRPI